jgi:predicted lipoprotein
MKFLITAVLALSIWGCAPGPTTHPGAVNSFDSTSYDTLVTAQAALEQAKTQFASTPAAVPYLNKAISAYNVAEAGWQAYHSTAGGSVTATQLTQELNDALSAIAAVQKTFAPNTVPTSTPTTGAPK